MIQKKRHHPLSIIFDLWGYVKGAFIPAIVLFVLNYNSDTFTMKYGRYAFILITILAVVFIILRWLTYKYELKEHAFHLYSGYLDREEQMVPYDKIQNINRKTSSLHRFFHMTSIQFETAKTGKNATVTFNVVTEQEAKKMEDAVYAKPETAHLTKEKEEANNIISSELDKRVIHFTPTTQDTIRASFTSLNFLILLPILFSVFVKMDQIFDMEDKAEGIIALAFQTW